MPPVEAKSPEVDMKAMRSSSTVGLLQALKFTKHQSTSPIRDFPSTRRIEAIVRRFAPSPKGHFLYHPGKSKHLALAPVLHSRGTSATLHQIVFSTPAA